MKNALVKNMITKHRGENPGYLMKKESQHMNNLPRCIMEGILIEREPGETILNCKSEWGRGKLVRSNPTVKRI